MNREDLAVELDLGLEDQGGDCQDLRWHSWSCFQWKLQS